MVPSCAGGSSTPFLSAPWVRTGCGGPQGLFLVLLSVRCAAVHMRQQDSHTGISPEDTRSKSPDRVRTDSAPAFTSRTRGSGKKIQRNPESMATPRAPRESYFTYGPARAGRRAVHLLLRTLLLTSENLRKKLPPAHEAPVRSSPTAESARSANPTPLSPDSHWLCRFSRASAGPQALRFPARPRGSRRGSPLRGRSAASAAWTGPHQYDASQYRPPRRLRARSGAASGGPRPCR